MKTINIIMRSVGILLLLTVVSCKDFLEVEPHDSTSDQTSLVTIEDYDMLIRDPYSNLRATIGETFILLPDVMSDNLTLCYAGRSSYNEFFDFTFNSTTFGVSTMWTSAYNGIMATNEIIVRLDQDNQFTGTADEVMSKNILAEALAMRAFLHFQLVRLYGKDFKVASDTDLGVTYKETPEVNLPARNTVKDVYSKIVIDLEKAATLMTDSYNTKANSRINKKSLHAIMAKIYLTMGKYTEAANNATLAIAGDGSDIATRAKFTNLWTTTDMATSSEILLRYPVLSSDDEIPGNAWGQGESKASYKAEYVVSAEFISKFKTEDIRTTATTTPVSSAGKNYNAVWKWNGRTGESMGKIDIPAIRVSEMYLTRAEAYYRMGGKENLALNDLNYLRAKRYSNFSAENPETGADILNAIVLERRLELAFEGDRFFELKRNGWNVVRDARGDQANGAGTPPSTQLVPSTSPYFLLPIPQSEIEANGNMEQNRY